MKTLVMIRFMLLSPRRTSRALRNERNIAPSFWLVLGYGGLVALGFLISALQRDYPPPPETLAVWIAAWGEFTMLPFLKISPENYRPFEAILMLPLALAIWMLMAGSGRLLSILFGGRVSYEAYLNLFGLAFFPFLLLAAVLDTIYSGFLDPFIVPALQNVYGPLARIFFTNFPPLMYIIVLGLGAVYNSIAVHSAEGFGWLKAILSGFIAFAWAILLLTVLLR
jgi:hypothetical protein